MSAPSVLFDAPGPRARRRILIGNIVAAVVVAGIGVWALTRLGAKGQLASVMWEPFVTGRAWQSYLLPGLRATLQAAAYSIVGALALGLLLGLGRLSPARFLRSACGVVVEFFRAVPVLLMMIFVWRALAILGTVPREILPSWP